MPNQLLAWAAIVLPVLTFAVPAQGPRHAPSLLRSACGLHPLDGELWGVGPDFKVAFREGGVEFTPALGNRAPRNFPVQLRLASIGRGDHTVPVATATPAADGLTASYRHDGFVEQYEVSPRGIEQSFVFDRLPDGDGDLVVRVALATELPLTHSGDDGLRFELDGIGGVAIGAVTGIDARGERTRGSIRCADRGIELRLPASFVERAALPLVLDPQIGAVFPLIVTASDYQEPELAAPFSAGGDYLCVFEREISATDHDIRALRVATAGGPSGSLLAVTTGTGNDRNPTAGGIRLRSSWVVVYERAGDLFVRAIDGVGTIGNEATAVSGADNQVEPDLGSEVTSADDDAILVFRNATQNRAQATQITLFASGLLATAAPFTFASGTLLVNIGRPRISHGGGTAGRWLVVYPRTSTITGSDTKQQLVVFDRDLNVLATDTLTTTSDDEDDADVDGDGDTWVVVWEAEATEGSGDNDIRAAGVWLDEHQGTMFVDSSTLVTSLVNVDEIDPTIACFHDGSALVAWRRRASPAAANTEVFMKTIDRIQCVECEPTVLLANTSAIETNLTAATHPFDPNHGMVLWETSIAGTGNGDLHGVVWDAEDGTQETPFGGQGCGPVLETRSGCARVGNLNHTVQVHGTDGQSVSTFVLSLSSSWIQCGSCRLYANPFDNLVFPFVAGVDGFATFLLSIPPFPELRGITVYAQWIVNAPTATAACPWLSADFSNAIAITIE